MTLIELIEQYGLPTLALLASGLCAWRALRRDDSEAEKPKRKHVSAHDLYAQRLAGIEEEAAYQRSLVEKEYQHSLEEEALRRGSFDTSSEVYKPIYGLSEE
jgi:hypothetical protein